MHEAEDRARQRRREIEDGLKSRLDNLFNEFHVKIEHEQSAAEQHLAKIEAQLKRERTKYRQKTAAINTSTHKNDDTGSAHALRHAIDCLAAQLDRGLPTGVSDVMIPATVQHERASEVIALEATTPEAIEGI